MTDSHHITEFNKLATSAQVRTADYKTINEFGIDGFTLMEIAASGAANIIHQKTGDQKSGLFVCGKGNNAGDAIACARYLNQIAGHRITLLFVLGDSSLSPDTQKNLGLILKLKEHGEKISIIDSLDDHFTQTYDYIVDGIFGTGLNSRIDGIPADNIQKINHSDLPVYSLDVPSGLDSDQGLIHGIAVKADHTITFGLNKIGFYLNGASEFTGNVELVALPFPNHHKQYEATLINSNLDVRIESHQRKAKHKYEQGVVHILAGSEGMSGAAIMAAQSAWKKGAGAVFLYSPKKLLPIYEKNLPQIIKVAVGNDDDTHFKPSHIDDVLKSIHNKPGVLLMGPGVGTSKETKGFLFDILKNCDFETILDADALSIFERIKNFSADKRKKWIFTPHIGEAKSYLNLTFTNDFERLQAAKSFVTQYSSSILLKGNPSLFVDRTSKQFITEYDTSMFTRAGFGDVLAGTIATNIGITGEYTHSVLDALITGYHSYHQFPENRVFGPEHLL